MHRRRILILPFTAAGLWTSAAIAQKRKPVTETALLAGTVFRDPGFSFPGVQVFLEPAPEGKPSVKVKKMKAISDSRGEFAFRVPAVAMRYTLRFQAEGFQPETKEVTVSGPERQDIHVTLKAAKGGT
jgi:hypothetical protein